MVVDEKKSLVKSRLSTVKTLLDKAKPALQTALPEHLTVDRLLRMATTALTKNPQLLNCSQESFLLAVMNAAQTGLEPDTPTQEAHLIPYKNQVSFQIGYRGFLKLGRQSGEIAFIDAYNVYEGDEFDYALGTDPYVKHKPNIDGGRGKYKFTYSVAHFKAEGMKPSIEIMTEDQIEKVRAKSPARNSGPWITDTDEMRRKTCLKRHCKRLPQSSQLAMAIHLDNKAEMGERQDDTVSDEVLDAFGVSRDNEVEQPLTEEAMSPGDPATHQSVKGRTTDKKKASKEDNAPHTKKSEPESSLSNHDAEEERSPAPANKKDQLARYEHLFDQPVMDKWNGNEAIYDMIKELDDKDQLERMPTKMLEKKLDAIFEKIDELPGEREIETVANGRSW